MRRILLLLTVALVMAAMMVSGTASAAFAHDEPCVGNPIGVGSEVGLQSGKDRNGDGLVCIYFNQNSGETTFKDNHVHKN
jgi:hypothetical protein